MENAETKETFIREVQVNYRTTDIHRQTLTAPEDVAEFVRKILPDNSREHFLTLYLDGSKQVASYAVVSTGTANATCAHPREIFQRAVLVGAVSIILAHNHPGGSVTPSEADISMTKRLNEAAEILNITLLDHVIVTDTQHVSLRHDGYFS